MSTNINIEPQVNPADALAALLKSYTKTHAPSQRDLLMLALSLVQVVQRADGHDPKLLSAAGQVVKLLNLLPVGRLQFPLMSTLLSHKYSDILETNAVPESYRHKVLLESLLTFLNIIQTSPDHANETTLYNVVSLVASQQPRATTVPYPAINYRSSLLKVFNPGHVAAVDLEPLSVIVYRGELLGGGFGPELWGLAYSKEDTAHVILETGEYVAMPANSLTMASTKDYDTNELPPYLLASAQLFLPSLFAHIYNYNLPSELQTRVAKMLKHLGVFTADIPTEFIPAAEVAACENVIDSARWRMDDKQKGGAIKTVTIGKSCLQVIISAQQAAIRPYITAVLAQSDTNDVLLRLDTPREFSAKGVYLFPAGEKSAALVVI